MNLADVMEEAGALLDTLTGLRVHRHPPGSVVPPAGVVSYPDSITFDVTGGRGVDRIDGLTVTLVVGKVTERRARDEIAAYAAGSGPKSIKALFEGHPWETCDDLTLSRCEFEIATIGGVDYLAATFYADVLGEGE